MLNHQFVETPHRADRETANPAGHGSWLRWPAIALIGILLLCAVVPYLNTLKNGFVYDDSSQILNNPYIRSPHHLREILFTNVWSYRGGAPGVTNYYRPLMLLSYLFCFSLFGPHAFAFHALNILLHAAVVIILFKITERMFQEPVVAFATAAIFALHPIHTEPVAWIAALTDLELTFFYLLTFWVFLQLSRWSGRRLALAYFGMAGSFALALFSKEPAVTLPLLATIYEHFHRDDRVQTGWLRKLSRYGALWTIDLAYLALRMHFLGAFAPQKPSRNLLAGDVLLAAIALVGQYLWKFLWPVRLCAFYVFPHDLADVFGWMVAGAFFLALLAVLAWALWSRVRLLCFGFVWFLVTLAPALNPRWMPESVLAERYLYLPSVGLCWVFGWAVARGFQMTAARRHFWRVGLCGATAALAILCFTGIVRRNRDWHDDVTLYTRTLAVSPNAFQMLNNLGQVYYDGGKPEAAEREWLRAHKLWPTNYIVLENLGLVYTDEQRYDEAVDILEESLRVTPNNPDAYVNLGKVYLAMGQRQLAEQQFRTALTLAPLDVRAHNLLGELYLTEKRYGEAIQQFSHSLESVPTIRAYRGAAVAYGQSGAKEQAEAAFRKAEAMDPRDAQTRFAAASFYAETGRKQEAVEQYQAGLQIDPNNSEARAAFQKLSAGNSGAPAR